MSGIWFIIVLVTLFTQSLNSRRLEPEERNIYAGMKLLAPNHPFDNACTRITPAATLDQTIGTYKVVYSGKVLDRCTLYEIAYEGYYITRTIISPTANKFMVHKMTSYEHQNKLGEMDVYPIDYNIGAIKKFEIPPDYISAIAAYKKDVGVGFITCPSKNGSNVTDFLVLANRSAKEADVDALKDEVEKIIGGIEIHPVNQTGCPYSLKNVVHPHKSKSKCNKMLK
ncbi:hypothetical protein CHUAL_000184 [Chamberlinius hualienensis]